MGDGTAGNFSSFCAEWMSKLAARQAHNREKANIRKQNRQFVMEYKGYSRGAMRCESKPTGVSSNPFVGKLVYHELQYRKADKTRSEVRRSQPEILQRLEVLEIFRFDGTRWVY